MTSAGAFEFDNPEARTRPRASTRSRGEARRRAILDVARQLFASRGFNSVSLADIAAVVGITQAGILHYFPTKAALLLAVLQERESRNIETLDKLQAAGDDPLRAYVATLAENDQQPELVRLFVILSAESTADQHPSHEWFLHRNSNLMTSMTARVERVVDPSKLPAGVTPEVVARWLLAIAHGLGAQWVFDPDAFDRAGHVSLFLDLLRPYMRDAGDAPR